MDKQVWKKALQRSNSRFPGAHISTASKAPSKQSLRKHLTQLVGTLCEIIIGIASEAGVACREASMEYTELQVQILQLCQFNAHVIDRNQIHLASKTAARRIALQKAYHNQKEQDVLPPIRQCRTR